MLCATLAACSAGCSQAGGAAHTPVVSGVVHESAQPRKRVIILCTGNSCRSQMAEAFWRHHGGERWDVVSAGTRPSGSVYPPAITAMAEKGIDISGQRSKSLQPYLQESFDLVITVCDDADKNCPTFRNGRKYIHHGFDDPPKFHGTDQQKLEVTRRVRDEIEIQVKQWIAANS
jgi:arsenate reductase